MSSGASQDRERTVALELPASRQDVAQLQAGDWVRLRGTLFVARDAAHKRLMNALQCGEELPISLENQTIYYCGPSFGPDKSIGAAGPTTSRRMDFCTPRMLEQGVTVTIGKGPRSNEVIDSMRTFGAVYLVSPGGAGALLGSRIKRAEIVAYADLGPEAIYRFEVSDFPAVVAIDSHGAALFRETSNRKETCKQ